MEVREERHVGFLEGASSLDDGERDGRSVKRGYGL